MKILLLNLIMSVSTHANKTGAVEDYTWVLDELNAEAAEMVLPELGESKVKVFDADGNFVDEILYLGDSYFLWKIK